MAEPDTTPLPPEFYLQDTVTVARGLIGRLLVKETPEGLAGGYIVEAEAYLQDDPACHAYRHPPDDACAGPRVRMTPRNRAMFGPPGTAYVYFTYGYHNLFNAVCQPPGVPEAVLVRALEPWQGVELMACRRRRPLAQLTNGPGKLAQALGIELGDNGAELYRSHLRLLAGREVPPARIGQATRIGIRQAADQPWRFYQVDSPWVSVKPGAIVTIAHQPVTR